MNESMQRRHLEEAERHIARGRQLIATKEELISRLGKAGADTRQARELLKNLLISQDHHLAHREIILQELSGIASHARTE